MRISTSDNAHHIVKDAVRHVHCACGYAHDSNAATTDEAIADIATRHRCANPAFTVEHYTCDDCDEALPLHRRIMFEKHGQTFALCRKCARKYRQNA